MGTERRHRRSSCDAMNGVLDSDGQKSTGVPVGVLWEGGGKFASSRPLPRHAWMRFFLRAGTTVFVGISMFRTAWERHDTGPCVNHVALSTHQSVAKVERKCAARGLAFSHMAAPPAIASLELGSTATQERGSCPPLFPTLIFLS